MKEKSSYKSLSEWRKANPKDYLIAYRKGVLLEICKTFGWKANWKRDTTEGIKGPNKIAEVLRSQGRKRVWVSNKMKISPNKITSWCINEKQPSKKDLIKLSKIINCKIEDLK